MVTRADVGTTCPEWIQKQEMIMSIYNRIKRLIASDAHAFVAGLEEPKAVLAQAIREMESELARTEADLKTRQARLETARRKKSRREEECMVLESDITLAIDEKREDLAKPLIRKSLAFKSEVERLEREIAALSREVDSLAGDFTEKRRSFDEICVRSETLDVRKEDDGAFACAERIVGAETSLEHDVELELIKRMKARSV
jgi:phage shock protein A